MARFPVLGAHIVLGVGECRGVFAVFGGEVPADVVTVGVGHYDHIHVFGAGAVGFHVVQQLTPGCFGGLFGSQAGIDGDGVAVRLDQETGQVEANSVGGGQMGLLSLPVLRRYIRKEIAEVELQNSI